MNTSISTLVTEELSLLKHVPPLPLFLLQPLSTPKTHLTPPKKLKKPQTFNFIIIILNKTTDYREEFTLKALSFRDSRCRELKVQQPQLWSR